MQGCQSSLVHRRKVCTQLPGFFLPLVYHSSSIGSVWMIAYGHDQQWVELQFITQILCHRYGVKMEAIALVQEWIESIGNAAGLSPHNTNLSSGAIGVPESRIEVGRRGQTGLKHRHSMISGFWALSCRCNMLQVLSSCADRNWQFS